MSILIEEWMIGGKLGLKGCELLVFAYAYSFYRDGKKLFASEGNLGSLICYSRKQVDLSLDRLCEKGLLLRSESKHPGHNTYCYSVCEARLRTFVTHRCDESSHWDEKKLPTAMGRNVTPACNFSSHNNERYSFMNKPIDKDSTNRVKKENYGTHTNPALDVGSPEEFKGGNRL